MKRFLIGVLAALATAAPAAAATPQLWSHGGDRAPRNAVAHRAAAPGTWCGSELYADDTTDQVDNGLYRFHALYLVPADGKLALDRVGDDIQQDAMDASGLIERQYGRAIRFDMGTTCGPQYLDITTVRLPQTTAELVRAARNAKLFDLVRSDIAAAGFWLDDGGVSGLATNYVAWLDGPSRGGICGQAELYADARRNAENFNNTGGKVAVVYNAGTGQCGPDVVRHEIGHTLGALQPDAPHAYDGAHCNDALEDTMCELGPERGRGRPRSEFFDYANDDYWSPPGAAPLPWWTLELSRFLCMDPACNRHAPAASAPAAGVAERAGGRPQPATRAKAKPKPKPRSKAKRKRAPRPRRTPPAPKKGR